MTTVISTEQSYLTVSFNYPLFYRHCRSPLQHYRVYRKLFNCGVKCHSSFHDHLTPLIVLLDRLLLYVSIAVTGLRVQHRHGRQDWTTGGCCVRVHGQQA